MRHLTLLVLVTILSVSCKCKKKETASTAVVTKETVVTPDVITTTSDVDGGGGGIDPDMAIATGKVSHKYKPGCPAVIIFTDENNETVTLIPKDNLGDADVEGIEIQFNYRLLRMQNPEGCTIGRMAEIRNIKKK